MKMDFDIDEINVMTEKAGDMFKTKLEEMQKEFGADLTLRQVRDARQEVFYETYHSFIQYIEDNDYSHYNYEQVGRYSHYLYTSLQSVWLEFMY